MIQSGKQSKSLSSMNAMKKVKIEDKHVLIKADREFFGRMLIRQEKEACPNFLLFFCCRMIISKF